MNLKRSITIIKIIKLTLVSIISIITLLILIISGIIAYTTIIHRPTGERYIVGKLNGDIIELINSRFEYKTFSSNKSLVRKEELDIYAFGKFKIEFQNSEKYFIISRYSYTYEDNNYSISEFTELLINPDTLIPIDINNKRKFSYSIRTDTLYLNE
jgi:hypothetical protein